jgi:hypothetical protein
MDPWLEGELWMDVHHQLSAEIARQLSPKLLPKYFARAVRRNVIDDADEIQVTRPVLPDVSVLRSEAGRLPEGGTALAAPPLYMDTVLPMRVPHVTIEIRDAAQRELVTAIEVLSPTNKRGTGYAEYLGKRGRVLNSTAHLVEIDLLRAGRRVPMREVLPDAPYFVFVSRTEERPRTEIWPIPLADPLPAVPIPLLPEDPDVGLDLQQAFTTIYDVLGYGYEVDYGREPEVPLTEEQLAWAEERLRGVGQSG